MAVYNEINAGRFNRTLQKLLSMKGEPPAPQLAGEFVASFPFFWGAEMRYLEQWDRYGESLFVAAVAAQNSGVRLRNPAGSNIIVVVEKLSVQVGANDTILLLNQTADANLSLGAGPGGGSARLDSRGRPNSSSIVSTGNNVVGGTQIGRALSLANATYDFIQDENQELTILPGDQLDIRTTAVNEALGGMLIIRERQLEESERF